ncbi:MAG: rod shape-determining protein MreD [Acidimicrobiales bacterium]
MRLPLVVAVAVVLQGTLAASISIDGVHPDLMLAVVVAAGFVSGPSRAALVGFCVGLVADLFLDTPFGLSALADVLVGYGVGVVFSGVTEVSAMLIPLAGALASGAGVALYAVLGDIVGQSQMMHEHLVRVVVVVGLVNGVIALPARWVLGWALQAPRRPGVTARRLR